MIRSLPQLLTIAWLTVINAHRWNQFEVIWNVPSEKCKQWKEMELPENYGILVNQGHQFYGNTIVTLYEEKFGLYPYYSDFSDPRSAVNGGIPQRANLTNHLLKVRSDIKESIPNPDFDGLAIIDYEKWRPIWEHNWYTKRIYQNESVAYVKERYKNITEKYAKLIAENEFNNAAMEFLMKTINETKTIRPKGLWGFYGMPFCNYSAGKDGTAACGEVFEKFNDRLQPLYNEVIALYPSVYLPNRTSGMVGCLYVTSVLQETKRCAKMLKTRVPIFPFTAIEYFPLEFNDSYYIQEDLFNSLEKIFNMGMDGAIIWSTSKEMQNRCVSMGNYISKYVGPEVQKLKKLAETSGNITNNGHIIIGTNRTGEIQITFGNHQSILDISYKPFCPMKNGMTHYYRYGKNRKRNDIYLKFYHSIYDNIPDYNSPSSDF